ncbi:MAG: 2OG-Fe(II) oxygenase [Alphaproteobacteria bacterium]
MAILDIAALRATEVADDPFDHLICQRSLAMGAVADLRRDFPTIAAPGSLPESSLEFGPSFAALLLELRGEAFAQVMAEKFDMELEGRPVMITVRGQCRASDGKIHTDSGGKLLTILLYMNADWSNSDGRLRLLRNGDDINDYGAELAPAEGTLLAFRCTERAWHGHTSFEGERRSIQVNWVRSDGYLRRERFRHRVSALFKKRKAG